MDWNEPTPRPSLPPPRRPGLAGGYRFGTPGEEAAVLMAPGIEAVKETARRVPVSRLQRIGSQPVSGPAQKRQTRLACLGDQGLTACTGGRGVGEVAGAGLSAARSPVG
jgi:hypothetical protein